MKKHQELALVTACWFALSANFLQDLLTRSMPKSSLGALMYTLDFLILYLLPLVMVVFTVTNLVLTLLKLYCWIRYRTTELPDLPKGPD